MQRPSDDPAELRASLATCRQLLAELQEQQEPVAEELARERFAREDLESRAQRLAEVLEHHLLQPAPSNGPVARARRVVARRRRSRSEEWRQVELLRSSDLFSDAWYLLHYPGSFASGMPPALHYLREGASRGHDPSEHFATKAYLRDHPEVRRSGANPLVHFLENNPSGRTP